MIKIIYTKEVMPVGHIVWLAGVPAQSFVSNVLEQVLPITSEERDWFTVYANYWPTCLVSEKVLICGRDVYSCTVRDNILTLVRDDALDISRLIWMWDAERITIDELTLENIQQAMAL